MRASLPERTPEELALAAHRLATLRPGMRAAVITPHGSVQRGRVVIVNPGSVVLDCGGKHGTPVVATSRNLAL